jgi:hypothetical protein
MGAILDDMGKVTTFADLYGLDEKLAAALFGNTTLPSSLRLLRPMGS